MKQITRQLVNTTGVQIRQNEDGSPSRIIEGTAIVFGVKSDVLSDTSGRKIREIIAPEAVTKALLDASDIKMTLFHKMSNLLARSNKGKGTLSYSIDNEGVKFSFEAPKTVDGDKALELVGRGDIAGCSFMFIADYDDPKCVEIKALNDEIVCTVRKIETIMDMSLVITPAYPQTNVELRDAILGQNSEAEQLRKRQISDLRRMASTIL